MKYKYWLNNKNRLFIKPAKGKRVPVEGGFSLDKGNKLIYLLNEPLVWRRLYNLPSKISFVGNWSLNLNHDLELKLDETKNQFKGDRLTLKGEIISTDSDTLVFEISSLDERGQSHVQLLKLSGSWQADEFNRIIFIVKKSASPDTLTLGGAWQLNKNQQIIYTYDKTLLKRKAKISSTLTFEGFWQINSNNRLAYILSRSSQSRFDFRVQIESPNLYPKEGRIKYRIGIGLRKDNLSQGKTICLYGTWKFSRKAGLDFQMDYGRGEFREIKFGTNIYLNKENEITFLLTNKEKEPVGLNITFTHKFIRDSDAQAFLRLQGLLDRKERAIEAGVQIPF